MKKRSINTVISLFVIAFIFASSSYGEGPGEGMGDPPRHHMDRIVKELGLSPVQQEEFDKLRQDQRERDETMRSELAGRMEELKVELDKFDADRDRVYTIASEITAIRSDMLMQRIDGILAMKEVLTREQYETLQKKMDQLKGKRGKHRK